MWLLITQAELGIQLDDTLLKFSIIHQNSKHNNGIRQEYSLFYSYSTISKVLVHLPPRLYIVFQHIFCLSGTQYNQVLPGIKEIVL